MGKEQEQQPEPAYPGNVGCTYSGVPNGCAKIGCWAQSLLANIGDSERLEHVGIKAWQKEREAAIIAGAKSAGCPNVQ